MPFKAVKGGKFKSPSGKTYTKKQVALYYAHDGFPEAAKKRPPKKRRKARKKKVAK